MNQKQQTEISSPSLIRLPQVIARCGLSRSEIYRRIRAGDDFPKPFRLGPQTVVFDSTAIDQWIARRIAAARSAV